MNQFGELAFIVTGAVIALTLLLRRGHLNAKQRNAAVAAVFGLFLCGRYAGLISSPANWIFVFGCAGIMGMLAYNNLGFETDKQT